MPQFRLDWDYQKIILSLTLFTLLVKALYTGQMAGGDGSLGYMLWLRNRYTAGNFSRVSLQNEEHISTRPALGMLDCMFGSWVNCVGCCNVGLNQWAAGRVCFTWWHNQAEG